MLDYFSDGIITVMHNRYETRYILTAYLLKRDATSFPLTVIPYPALMLAVKVEDATNYLKPMYVC